MLQWTALKVNVSGGVWVCVWVCVGVCVVAYACVHLHHCLQDGVITELEGQLKRLRQDREQAVTASNRMARDKVCLNPQY